MKDVIFETTGLALGSTVFGGCSSIQAQSENEPRHQDKQENKDLDSSLGGKSGIRETGITGSPMKTLLVLVSYHHRNTEKIAAALANVLNAQIKTPRHITIEELQEYDLVGFGSGIYDQKHHTSVLDLAGKLPQSDNRKAFIFSTSGVSRKFALKHSIDDPHTALREILRSKGYMIGDEFNCAGWDTNSFLKLIGGINRGKPNAEDLRNAEEFAGNLIPGAYIR